jgi:hypothetical protein
MMATAQHYAGQHWSGLHVPIIHGLGDTRMETGEDYATGCPSRHSHDGG